MLLKTDEPKLVYAAMFFVIDDWDYPQTLGEYLQKIEKNHTHGGMEHDNYNNEYRDIMQLVHCIDLHPAFEGDFKEKVYVFHQMSSWLKPMLVWKQYNNGLCFALSHEPITAFDDFEEPCRDKWVIDTANGKIEKYECSYGSV